MSDNPTKQPDIPDACPRIMQRRPGHELKQLLEAHAGHLLEHFESVVIIGTRSVPDKDAELHCVTVGNTFAAVESVRQFLRNGYAADEPEGGDCDDDEDDG